MNIKFSNCRKFKRINFDGQVNIDFINGHYYHCRIKNFNLTGMFILGDFQQQLNENCLVSFFQTPKFKETNFRSSARVIWQNEEGIAIKFASMTFDSYALLVTTLIGEAGDPVVIKKELPDSCPFEIIRYSRILPEVMIARA